MSGGVPQGGRGSSLASGRAVLGNEALVTAHLTDGATDQPADIAKKLLELLTPQIVGERMMASRQDALPHHDLQPRVLGEELLALPEDLARGFKNLHLVPESVWRWQCGAAPPEWRVAPLGRAVVENQKIAHLLVFPPGVAIVFFDDRRIETAIGKQRQQPADPGLDQVDGRRLQR